METRTDEVKKGMFLHPKTPHGAYIKGPQASERQTIVSSDLVQTYLNLISDLTETWHSLTSDNISD